MKPYRLTVALFLASVLTLGFAVDTTKVFAVQDVTFYSGNDILFYDPDAKECTSQSASLAGNSVKEKIWNYLTGKGLSPEQAAGVMGNMAAESGYTPTRRQGNGDLWNSDYTNNAWGLAQWDGGRRYTPPKKPGGSKGGVLGKLSEKHPELVKYTAVEWGGSDANNKVPPKDLDTLLLFELDYLYNESTNRRVTEKRYGVKENEWETLKLTTTVEDATVFWHNNFEVSADSPSRVIQARGGFAKDAYEEFKGKTGSAGSSEGCSAPTGDLAAKTLQYAWPEYHAAGYVKKKPDYELAVKKAKDEGRYTGDGCHGGGVDCGAFVTILLHDSGFDPTYNHNGKGGYTVIQREWAEKNWETLGSGSSINVADLRPGDVAHKPGHTFLFVGKDITNFGQGDPAFKGVASASQCERAPMAGHESMVDSDVTWFRKK